MTKQTQPYSRSFRNTMGAGIGSLMGGSGKQYYILEHKISSKYHKVGEAQEIIVDHIELGRSPKCQVRFDESFTTVSRQHAAIKKDGEKWKLVHLSEGNSTLLNGDKIAKEWYLQSGDEIQLSVRGPKLGFIVPTGKKSTVGSIGFTRRLSLFRKQALRPYKQAIAALSIVLILAVGGFSAWNINEKIKMTELTKKHNEMVSEMENTQKEHARKDSIYQAQILTMQERHKDAESKAAALQAKIDELGKINDALGQRIDSLVDRPPQPPPPSTLANYSRYVYFVLLTKYVVEWPDGKVEEYKDGSSGTGFLLNDGRFVTARHVTEPWFYYESGGEIEKDMIILNYAAHNGGKVVAHLTAFSSSGDRISFTSDDVVCNRTTDRDRVDEDGDPVRLARPDSTDWAYVRTQKREGLNYDANMSGSLQMGVDLTVFGFPFGIGGDDPSNIKPQYSTAKTTSEGLTYGRIFASNIGYESGNSGGPVFYTTRSGLAVVGIVSSGLGDNSGFIVPISVIN